MTTELYKSIILGERTYTRLQAGRLPRLSSITVTPLRGDLAASGLSCGGNATGIGNRAAAVPPFMLAGSR